MLTQYGLSSRKRLTPLINGPPRLDILSSHLGEVRLYGFFLYTPGCYYFLAGLGLKWAHSFRGLLLSGFISGHNF